MDSPPAVLMMRQAANGSLDGWRQACLMRAFTAHFLRNRRNLFIQIILFGLDLARALHRCGRVAVCDPSAIALAVTTSSRVPCST
jgi:hypothetical protein